LTKFKINSIHIYVFKAVYYENIYSIINLINLQNKIKAIQPSITEMIMYCTYKPCLQNQERERETGNR
jgi:hypothetical protein